MSVNWVWLVCVIAIVAAIRVTIMFLSRCRQQHQMTQNLDEFRKRIEAMEARHLHENETRAAVDQ